MVLDLDLTLVRACRAPLGKGSFLLEAAPPLLEGVWVQKRPWADELLSWLAAQALDVSVFTASTEAYASRVVQRLDPSRAVIRRLLCRRRCSFDPEAEAYFKDLTAFGRRDLRRTVLVDNDMRVFKLQPDNGIHVADWLGSGLDEELLRVRGLLRELMDVADVRPALRSRLNLAPRVRECYRGRLPPGGHAAVHPAGPWTWLVLALLAISIIAVAWALLSTQSCSLRE